MSAKHNKSANKRYFFKTFTTFLVNNCHFKVQFCPVLVLDYEFDFADGQCRFAGILHNCAIADWMKSDMFAYEALQLGPSINFLKTK